MRRTEIFRTMSCGASAAAILAVLAACSTAPKPPVPPAYSPPPIQAQLPPPAGEPSKAELMVPDEPSIDSWTRKYSVEKHKSFQVQLDRARDYVIPCQEIFREKGLPEDLVWVALVESGFTPTARSRANAVGMFQFIEATGRRYRLEQNHWVDERRHPLKAARAAADYLSFLYDSFGSWPLALAGYNCGENAVQAALDQSGLKTFWELRQNGYLPAETRDYVPKFYATVKIVRDVKQYGFHFEPHHTAPKHETVAVPGGVKLAWVEKHTGIPESTLRTCNPELCQPVTPPGNTNYDLCVPLGSGDAVQTALATCPLPSPEEMRERRALAFKPASEARTTTARAPAATAAPHRVKAGDTWFSLARTYQCSVAELASCNGVKPTPQTLKTGQILKIPSKGQTVKTAGKGQTLKIPESAQISKIPPKQQAVTLAASKAPAAKQARTTIVPAAAVRQEKKSCVAYPVRSGDTLWSIASKFGVSVEELCGNNKLRRDQKLVAGNTLTVCSDRPLPTAKTTKKKN